MFDFNDALRDRECGVQSSGVLEARREAFFQLLHQFLSPVGSRNGVGSGKLVNRHDGRWLAVQPAAQVIDLGAELDPRHILESHQRAIGISADHNGAKLLF